MGNFYLILDGQKWNDGLYRASYTQDLETDDYTCALATANKEVTRQIEAHYWEKLHQAVIVEVKDELDLVNLYADAEVRKQKKQLEDALRAGEAARLRAELAAKAADSFCTRGPLGELEDAVLQAVKPEQRAFLSTLFSSFKNLGG